jgi:hypothetical protein
VARPLYETEDDQLNEAAALYLFCRRFDLTYKKIRVLSDYTPDATFWRDGRRVGVGEVKVRTNARGEYPTYLISKAKLDSIWGRWHPTPFVLIVAWTDGTGWVTVDRNALDSWEVQRGGRTDRGDDLDIEDCYLIPIEQFRALVGPDLPS